MLNKTVGSRAVAQAIDIALTKLVANVNVSQNLNDGQIKIIVEDLLDKYPNESIEDFILVFKRARQGEFGTIYHLHSAVIFSWMEFYLNEKYEALEKKLKREQDPPYVPPTTETGKGYQEFLAYQKKLVEQAKGTPKISEKEIEEEGQEKPKKKIYVRPRTSEIEQKEKHFQYIQQNFDPISAKPLDCWMKEEEWNELNK